MPPIFKALRRDLGAIPADVARSLAADPECVTELQGSDRDTPLLEALRFDESLEIIHILVEGGANIHARDDAGKGVMSIAITRRIFPQILREQAEKDMYGRLTYLLNAGAAVNLRDMGGLTEMDNIITSADDFWKSREGPLWMPVLKQRLLWFHARGGETSGNAPRGPLGRALVAAVCDHFVWKILKRQFDPFLHRMIGTYRS